MPLLSEHNNNISLNEELFKRVKTVYNQKEQLSLTPEQTKLLENAHDGFIRRGSQSTGEAKKQPSINERIRQPYVHAVQRKQPERR